MQLLNNRIKKISSVLFRLFLVLYISAITLFAFADSIVPDRMSVTETDINASNINIEGIAEGREIETDARLFGKIPLKKVKLDVIPDSTLIPCGDVFGIKFFTEGVMVIRLSDIETKDGLENPAKEANLKEGDIIKSIDGKKINTVEEMASAIELSKGNELNVAYERDGILNKTKIKPSLCLTDKKYKTGIWVRDSTAGIGTMTYYNPRTGQFAGLGHGICDVDTGLLMPLLKASVVDVDITNIVKGKRGSPGELKGDFDRKKRGELVENTHHGVYGQLDETEISQREALEIGLKDEICEGDAYILCELDDKGVKKYSVRISKIKENEERKNFVIEVTDKELIKKTGGIVQGMSGSPVIQNGKLVGAVTHVLVNTPEKGYGIFIENMLLETDVLESSL